jgi:hypothetical protein
MNTGVCLQGFADGLFALVTVHPLDPDQGELITTHIR